MPDSHDRWHGMLALAAIEALPPSEADELAAHLARCPHCRTELEDLRATTAAMYVADLDVNDQPEPPPALLADRVVWAVAKARRGDRLRRRVRAGIAAAAACLAMFAAGLAVPGPAGPPQETLALDAQAGIEAEAALVAHTWGTEVKFEIVGLTDGERYEVTFLSRDGRRVSAGTILGVDDRPVVCAMNAALLRENAARLEVAASDGAVVLAAAVP